ncbi:MAG: TIM-barrel domain-containing protein [Terracidiphilus sp.]
MLWKAGILRTCRDGWEVMPILFLFFATSSMANAQMPGQDAPGPPPEQIEQTSHGIRATAGSEVLEVTVCADSVIHVVATPAPSAHASPRPWMLDAQQSCPGAPFTFAQDAKAASLKTAQLEVIVNIERGNLSFRSISGESLLNEGNSIPRTYEPVELNGEHTFRVTDRFSPSITEGLYGLGQHQNGMFNYRGATVELGQDNTDVAIPLLISSKGYGLMWNTAALTYFDNRFPLDMKLTSIAGKSIDYYFLYGPEIDAVLHEYRTMTGHTPMLPKWAYGFFQSKDRYVSLDEIREIAERYRREHIPLDAMVQDWFWWKTEGDPVFNSNYHDVEKDLDALHKENVHAMISVWGLLDPKSETYKVLDAKHELVSDAHVYDATNPEARDLYWEHLPGKLLAQGWDAFWLDSAEPEEYWPHMGDAILSSRQIAIGNGAEFTNVFPLLHTLGVQEHWKSQIPGKRVFLLTRSAFLGQQRVGATVWSGDVYGTYWGLSHQVPAGLSFALSGSPYWTTDIGGYWPPHEDPLADPAFQDLYARWFEYGTFCPIFRTHGHRPHNELWSFDKVEPILVSYDKLRYRLMPYIYSLAWKVTSEDYTIQRPLVMDWRRDSNTRNLGDQFMFGPAIMVNPVLKADANKRNVYLPAAAAWYDFWTGKSETGGQEIEADAPLDRIPLFVRAGSILPMGPQIEYATQDPAGPIELRVYRGADGKFDLYEDAGDGYEYEKGQHSVIPIQWNDTDSSLTIGARQGSFPGIIEHRKFRVVLVAGGHGTGVDVTSTANAEVSYEGNEVHATIK